MSARGSLLLETVLATGLAAIFGLALTQLVLVTSDATLRIEDRQEANYAAAQGIEALATIGFSDLANINNGHLVFSGGTWSTASGTETLWNGMTRAVTVQNVSRNGSCVVVGSGGSVDIDSKKLSSTVSWVDHAGLSQSITYSRHRTRYEDPQGPCFSVAADHVSLDTSTDQWTAAGNRQLMDLKIQNTGSTTITIDKVAFTWTPAANITRVTLDASTVWSNAGPGTPAGVQPSGTTLDIQNFSLTSGQTANFSNVLFSNTMTGGTLTLSVTFTDGSIFVSPAFVPDP